MKAQRTLQATINICDFCGSDTCYKSCDGCGKDICYNCRKNHAVEYSHAIFFSGSGDGLFCLQCDAAPPVTVKLLHSAFRQIADLQKERRAWEESFKLRANEAEEALAAIPRTTI